MEPTDNVHVPSWLIPGSFSLAGVAIAFLFWLIYGNEGVATSMDVSFLAPLNAFLNASSATALFLGYRAIRQGQPNTHRNFMLAALAFSALFLVSYIVYHTFHGDTKFQGTGLIRQLYFIILITHIIGSVVALPLIFVTVGLALTKKFPVHKRWARRTFPLWAYVSVTGVLVYVFLKVFNQT